MNSAHCLEVKTVKSAMLKDFNLFFFFPSEVKVCFWNYLPDDHTKTYTCSGEKTAHWWRWGEDARVFL